MHHARNPNLDDLQWIRRRWNPSRAYAESKLLDVTLAFALARRWPEVPSNAVDPGWVPTRMGGPTPPTTSTWASRPRSGWPPATTPEPLGPAAISTTAARTTPIPPPWIPRSRTACWSSARTSPGDRCHDLVRQARSVAVTGRRRQGGGFLPVRLRRRRAEAPRGRRRGSPGRAAADRRVGLQGPVRPRRQPARPRRQPARPHDPDRGRPDTRRVQKIRTSRCGLDRQSTRLNSSHVRISYAVFC